MYKPNKHHKSASIIMPIKTKFLLITCIILIHLSIVYNFITFFIKSSDNHYDINNDILVNCTQHKTGKHKQLAVNEFYNKQNRCSHNMDHKVTFFHAGKAGGGTISRELKMNKISGLSMSHPKPSSTKEAALQTGESKTLIIINLRDPIDRFVSAFKWRLVVLCSPDDTRKAGKRGAAHAPTEKCKTSKSMREEEKMMREVYNSNPNKMAEALCVDSPRYEQAVQDYDLILHTMPLSDWLSFLIQPDRIQEISNKGIEDVIALPMEKKEGQSETLFEHHIQQLSIYLLHRVKKHTMKEAEYILQQKPERIEDEKYLKAKEKWSHSSSKFQNNSDTSATPSSPLSALGECCLSRHLMTDYRIIQTMYLGNEDKGGSLNQHIPQPLDAHPSLQLACNWGSNEQQELCRDDLKSMISRRSSYLDESLGSCSKVVSS